MLAFKTWAPIDFHYTKESWQPLDPPFDRPPTCNTVGPLHIPEAEMPAPMATVEHLDASADPPTDADAYDTQCGR